MTINNHTTSNQCQSANSKKTRINSGVNLSGIKHKIVVMSGKGGVGKSTIAVNLAIALAHRGYNVGILDADMHGPSVPKLLGIPNSSLSVTEAGRILPAIVPPSIKVVSIAFLLENTDSPVIWRGPVKMTAIRQFLEEVEWGKLDYLIIDLPPGTGDEPLSVAQLIPNPDGALVITTPQDVALLSVRKSINFARAVNIRIIGLVENMAGMKCPHCGKYVSIFGEGKAERASTELDVPYLGKLPLDSEIVAGGDRGEPFATRNDGETIKSFNMIVSKILKSVEKKEVAG